jgi:hypothetical protein
VSLTYTTAPEVTADTCITAAPWNSLAAAFNDRLKGGVADPTWRIWWCASSVVRQLCASTEEASAPVDDFWRYWNLVDPRAGDVPFTCAAGENPVNPLSAFVFGEPSCFGRDPEDTRLTPLPADQGWPLHDYWLGSAVQHGGVASTGESAAAAYTVAFHEKIRSLYYGPTSYILPFGDRTDPGGTPSLDSYTVDSNGNSVLKFKRYLTFEGESYDLFAGIAPEEGAADGIRHDAPEQGTSNEWVMFIATHRADADETGCKPDSYGDVLAHLHDRCTMFDPRLNPFTGAPDLSDHITYGTGGPNSENPSGLRYAASHYAGFSRLNNSTTPSQAFLESCQVYVPDCELDSVTLEGAGASQLVVIRLIGRLRHTSTVANFAQYGTDVNGNVTEGGSVPTYRTDENAIMECLVDAAGTGPKCQVLEGDKAWDADTDECDGSCHPHFHFTRLMPKVFEEEAPNETSDSSDTQCVARQLEWGVRYVGKQCARWNIVRLGTGRALAGLRDPCKRPFRPILAVTWFPAYPSPLPSAQQKKYPHPDPGCQQGDRDAPLRVVPEADVAVPARRLDHDEVPRDDHHSQQQYQGVVIDRGVGLLRGQDAGGHHKHRAQERGGGTVQRQDLQPAPADEQVGGGEDRQGQQFFLVHRMSRSGKGPSGSSDRGNAFEERRRDATASRAAGQVERKTFLFPRQSPAPPPEIPADTEVMKHLAIADQRSNSTWSDRTTTSSDLQRKPSRGLGSTQRRRAAARQSRAVSLR